jgi:hypothetical protein
MKRSNAKRRQLKEAVVERLQACEAVGVADPVSDTG